MVATKIKPKEPDNLWKFKFNAVDETTKKTKTYEFIENPLRVKERISKYGFGDIYVIGIDPVTNLEGSTYFGTINEDGYTDMIKVMNYLRTKENWNE